MKIVVKEMKHKCLEGKIAFYAWLPTNKMMGVYCLKNDMKMPMARENLIRERIRVEGAM